MSTDDLLEFHEDMTHRARALCERKNHDYANPDESGNPFANFTRTEDMGVCSTFQGFLVRMTDKMSRLSTAAQRPLQVEDEGIEDTLLDLINYSVLLGAFLKQRGEQVSAELPKTTRPGHRVINPTASAEERDRAIGEAQAAGMTWSWGK